MIKIFPFLYRLVTGLFVIIIIIFKCLYHFKLCPLEVHIEEDK